MALVVMHGLPFVASSAESRTVSAMQMFTPLMHRGGMVPGDADADAGGGGGGGGATGDSTADQSEASKLVQLRNMAKAHKVALHWVCELVW